MKTTRLLSTLILTVCLGFGSVMAQNAARQVCPEKAEKPCKVKLTPEQRMEAQAQRMGKQLMLDDAKLAQFTSLYKENRANVPMRRFSRTSNSALKFVRKCSIPRRSTMLHSRKS